MTQSTNGRNNIDKKYFVKGKLRLLSPSIVASGDNVMADLQCIRDWEGNLILPATSLAGSIRHYLTKSAKDPKKIKHIFGSDDDNSEQSSFSFYDATALSSDIKTELRDGVKLDNLTKTTEKTGKYDYEVIPANNLFSFRMEVTVRKQESNIAFIEESLNFIIDQLVKGEISLGAKSTRGFGKIKLESVALLALDLTNNEGINKWVNFAWDGEWEGEKRDFENEFSNYQVKSNNLWEINFHIVDSLIIKMANSDIDGSDSVSLTSQGNPIISGTSWNGAIRHALLNAGRELDCEKKMEDLVNELFGYVDLNNKTAQRSRIFFSESYIKNGKTSTSHHNKVDRFTGGVVNNALFDEEPVYGGDVTLSVEIDSPKEYEIGLLLLALKELHNGIQTVGGNSNIGRGRLEAKDIKFTQADEKKYFTALQNKLNEEVK